MKEKAIQYSSRPGLNLKLKYSMLLAALALSGSLLIASNAFAGYLAISGVSEIIAKVEGDNLRISGLYHITNSGNETAKKVFPALKLGGWEWDGQPRNIISMGRESWKLDETFSLQVLGKADASLGAGQELPVKGQFPLVIYRNYQDMNAVPFSAADVVGISIGNLTAEELAALNLPQIDSKFDCESAGKLFSCFLTIRNQSNTDKKISVAYHTSRELQINTTAAVLDLDAFAQTSQASELENIRGLAGSSYAVFAVLQWAENGIRRQSRVSRIIKIEKIFNWKWLPQSVVRLLCFSALLLYIFVFRIPKTKI